MVAHLYLRTPRCVRRRITAPSLASLHADASDQQRSVDVCVPGILVDGQGGCHDRTSVNEAVKIITWHGMHKRTCHLAEIGDFGGFDRTYREFFSGIMPARTTVQSVLGSGIKVEIDAIARLPRGEDQ